MNNEDVREASRLKVPLSPARRAAMQALAVVKTGMNEMRIVQTIRMHKPFSGSQGVASKETERNSLFAAFND